MCGAQCLACTFPAKKPYGIESPLGDGRLALPYWELGTLYEDDWVPKVWLMITQVYSPCVTVPVSSVCISLCSCTLLEVPVRVAGLRF